MLAAALLLAYSSLHQTTKDAKQTFLEALEHYQTLDSFSATIEHDESSGLFPGSYTQSLKWKRSGQFELIVTKPAVYKKDAPRKNDAPNYYSDGSKVTSVFPDGRQTVAQIETDRHSEPGWAVSGGPIMSFLQKTSTSEIFRTPPPGLTIKYEFGTDTTWKGRKVRDIALTILAEGQRLKGHMYLDAAEPKLIGMSIPLSSTGQSGSMFYKEQAANPTLPDDLGTVPSK